MISIYVSSLGAYNNGLLTGQWTDLPVDNVQEDIIDKIDGAIGDEYFITDYEAPFTIGEYDNINELNNLALALEDKDIHNVEDLYYFMLVNNGFVPFEVYPFESNDSVNDLLDGLTPYDVFLTISHDKFSCNGDYLYFDGYGQLCTLTENQFQKEIEENVDDMIQDFRNNCL